MYERVLVPLDGSPESEQALPHAQAIADKTSARLELLEAIPGIDSLMRGLTFGDYGRNSYSTLSLDQWRDIQTRLRRNAQGRLNEVAKKVTTGSPVKATIAEGDPAEAIASEASREPGTLIVMSTHGRSGIGRWALGSVADKVLRAGEAPVLLVRSQKKPATAAIEGIVLPLDGSALSAGAIPHAVALARAFGVPVRVVHVRNPMASYYHADRYAPDLMLEQIQKAEETAEQYVRQVALRLEAEGVKEVTGVHVTADPGSAIVDLVGKAGDHLVVMTTRGRSGLQRAVLGSVTDRVVRHSSGPVLVIRPKD